MSRLPNLKRQDLDDARRVVYDSVCRARGAETLNEGGALVGPFNAFVHAPSIGGLLLDLANAFHYRTSLPPGSTELVILTVGAHWRSEFEWWAHSRRARDNGVPDSVIDAIGAGSVPEFDNPVDRTLYAQARQLVETGRVDADTYAAAEGILGPEGLVEVVSLCGYYTLISFLLNGFEVQVPAGEPRQWAS
jgi:4-carboxymuconolactone decarboxylase